MGYREHFSISPVTYLILPPKKTVRFYDAPENRPTELKAKFDHRAAILACAFNADGTKAFSGGLDASLREYAPFLSIIVFPANLLSKTRFRL